MPARAAVALSMFSTVRTARAAYSPLGRRRLVMNSRSDKQSAGSYAVLGDVGAAFRFDVFKYVPYAFAGFGDDLALFQPDRIHPKAEAQARILDNVWPTLLPLLAKR